jgi:hypothetical protein
VRHIRPGKNISRNLLALLFLLEQSSAAEGCFTSSAKLLMAKGWLTAWQSLTSAGISNLLHCTLQGGTLKRSMETLHKWKQQPVCRL